MGWIIAETNMGENSFQEERTGGAVEIYYRGLVKGKAGWFSWLAASLLNSASTDESLYSGDGVANHPGGHLRTLSLTRPQFRVLNFAFASLPILNSLSFVRWEEIFVVLPEF